MRRHAFTLIELMVVIAIIAIIAAIAIPKLMEREKAKSAGIPVLKYYNTDRQQFRVVVLFSDGETTERLVSYQEFKDTVIATETVKVKVEMEPNHAH
jgi:prepilin-type N-terminal cleavage/methylation domain-containing protein